MGPIFWLSRAQITACYTALSGATLLSSIAAVAAEDHSHGTGQVTGQTGTTEYWSGIRWPTTAGKHSQPTNFTLDWRNIVGMITAFLVSALANSAGNGGGPFLVPLFNFIVGMSLKQSTALSQPAMAGGAIVAVLYGLFHSHPTKPGLPRVSFRLALELGPPLILGTSLGVLVNPLVPDWLILGLLTVVLLLLAGRVLMKAFELHAAETHARSQARASNEGPQDGKLNASQSGRAADRSGDLKVKSHPVSFDRMSPAPSSTDSIIWDIDDEVPSSPMAPEPGSPWPTDTSPAFRDSEDETAFNYAPVDARSGPGRSRFAPSGSAADGPAQEPGSPAVMSFKRRRQLAWVMIVVEGLLLAGIVAGFLLLQTVKTPYNKCTWQFVALYAAQGALCLWVSLAWIGLPIIWERILRARARASSDAEAPLLRRAESFLLVHPAATTLFLATLVSFLGGCMAGLVGLGGGVVLGPLLLELGVHPLVAAATAILLVACNSISATADFALEDKLPLAYGGVYAGVCALGSLLGVSGVAVLVRRSGRPSIVVFILALVIGAGGLSTAILGGFNAYEEIQRDGFAGFKDICST